MSKIITQERNRISKWLRQKTETNGEIIIGWIIIIVFSFAIGFAFGGINGDC